MVVINEGSLLFEDDGVYVEVEVSEQTFEQRAVETGLSDGINIEVLSGITETEKIKKR